MHLFLTIGDCVISVSPTLTAPGDARHVVTVQDNWHAGNHAENPDRDISPAQISKTVVVESEPAAIAIVADFLQPMEHPDRVGPFRQHFPEHAP